MNVGETKPSKLVARSLALSRVRNNRRASTLFFATDLRDDLRRLFRAFAISLLTARMADPFSLGLSGLSLRLATPAKGTILERINYKKKERDFIPVPFH